MKKKIFLHIGTEKTGTTSLQFFCSINNSRLSDQGFYYPFLEELPYVNHRMHAPLAGSLLPERPEFIPTEKYQDRNALFAHFKHDITKRQESNIIVSAEHFSSRCSQPEAVNFINNVLSEFDIRIVVYIRPQHELLFSAYSTYLKNGGTETLYQVIKSPDGWLHPENNYFNYHSMLKPWIDIFGRDSIILRIFENKSLVNNNLIDDFLSVLGVENDPGFQKDIVRNKSLSAVGADLLLIANQFFDEFSVDCETDWQTGQKFRKEIMQFLQSGPSLGKTIPATAIKHISNMYAKSNAELANILRPDLGEALFQAVEPDTSYTCYLKPDIISVDFVEWLVSTWRKAHGNR